MTVRAAVVGHTEWVTFARVSRLPVAGEILHAEAAWEDAGGGGAVAAAELARLGAEPVDFFCALGDDAAGAATRARLEGLGVRVHAAVRSRPQRRALTLLDGAGERTIVVLGERLAPAGDDPLPWGELARARAAYFCSGDPAALRAARAARVLVATGRARDAVRGSGVRLDALVAADGDPGEVLEPAELSPCPELALLTRGAAGGAWTSRRGATGEWAAVPPPGPVTDAYGCGDRFAAGLALGLARDGGLEQALALAAASGAAALTRRGAHG